MTTKNLPAVTADGGFSRFLREAWKFPVLDPETEYMLACRLRDHADTEAAQTLVTSHLRLVAKIAMQYRGYGLPVADLVSEGTIGLMKAVRKFDPEKGFRLATYAMWWIRASVTEYVLASWSMVRTGTMAAQKKLFFSLRKMKAHLGAVEGGDLTAAHTRKIADLTGVSDADVTMMNRRLMGRDSSLNAPMNDEDGSMEFQDTLVDDRPDPETTVVEGQEAAYRSAKLRDALGTLSDRERTIIERRQLAEEPETLEVLGQEFGISRERVRQLEARALKALRAALEGDAAFAPNRG